MEKIILASNSPRRRALLAQAGIPFEAVAANINEDIEFNHEISPYDMVKIISTKKAMEVCARAEASAIIIAADTVVSIAGKVFGKPKSEAHAFEMLKLLQGKLHSVYTGVTVVAKSDSGIELKTFVDNTSVKIRELSDNEIWAYIKTGEPFDKAGAYAIQEKGSLLVDGIEGDYFTVVGLPLVKLFLVLRDFGVNLEHFWQRR